MTCKNCCPNVLKVTSVADSGGSFLLNVDKTNTNTPINECKYMIVIPCSLIPAISTISQVFIVLNGVNYPLIDRCVGNNVYSDQLRFIPNNECGNKVLRLVYGSLQPHFKIISHYLPKTSKAL